MTATHSALPKVGRENLALCVTSLALDHVGDLSEAVGPRWRMPEAAGPRWIKRLPRLNRVSDFTKFEFSSTAVD